MKWVSTIPSVGAGNLVICYLLRWTVWLLVHAASGTGSDRELEPRVVSYRATSCGPHELDVAEPVVFAVANLDGHVQFAAVVGDEKSRGARWNGSEPVLHAGGGPGQRSGGRQHAPPRR